MKRHKIQEVVSLLGYNLIAEPTKMKHECQDICIDIAAQR